MISKGTHPEPELFDVTKCYLQNLKPGNHLYYDMIVLLIQYIRISGFEWIIDVQNLKLPIYLDIPEGRFCNCTKSDYIHEDYWLFQTFTIPHDGLSALNSTEKLNILHRLIEYCKYHIPGFKTVKSLDFLSIIGF